MHSSIQAHRRNGFLAAVVGLALLAALSTGMFGGGPTSAAYGGTASAHGDHAKPTTIALTPAQAAFQDEMRRLWEDHVTWTRLAIVTFADDSASFGATATRLMRNQDDIGDAIKPYFGDAAAAQLTALLKDHIAIAVELLQAARSGDEAAFEEAHDDWYANSDDIARFLAQANPRFWPEDTMIAAMRGHLDQTLAEAGHELAGDYTASVADYDEIHHHILGMADLLSSGIVRAFPHRFH